MGKQHPFGYHVVNMVLHITTAWALYLMCHAILSQGQPKKTEAENGRRIIALLAALLWASNPIQTQAVTYVVQRMAIMAALFYLLGMLCYLKARTTHVACKRWLFFSMGFACFLFGLGSKENAVLLPFSLLLLEWIVLQKARIGFIRKHQAWVGLVGGVLVLSMALFFAEGTFLDYIRGKYASRPFTMEERLLTQPRIVLHYLSQIVVPLPQRLSIAHDVALSDSIWNPWQTLPAMLIVFSSIAAALLFSRRMPLVSLAALFFFVNHAVESSIWPLELVYEHRNYLPSLFLFLPFSAGIYGWIKRLRHRNNWLPATITIALALLVVFFCAGTYHRNKAWATEVTLWEDAVHKAPLNYRANFRFALSLAWSDQPTEAQYNQALEAFNRCLTLTSQNVRESRLNRANIKGNIGSIHFRKGEYQTAVAHFQDALELYPGFGRIRYDMIQAMLKSGKIEEARVQSDILVDQYPGNPDYRRLRDVARFWKNKENHVN